MLDISHNFITVLLKSLIKRIEELTLDNQYKLVNLLIETNQSLKSIPDEIIKLFNYCNHSSRLKLLPKLMDTEHIDSTDLCSYLKEMEKTGENNIFIYYVIKAVIGSTNINYLVALKDIFKENILNQIVKLKISIESYDITSLFEFKMENSEVANELIPLIEDLNQQVKDMQRKLSCLWKNHSFDASNSIRSNYALSEEICEPQKVLEGHFINNRIIVGKGFGAILNKNMNLYSLDIEKECLNILPVEEKIISGPVEIEGNFVVSTESELMVLSYEGKVVETEFLFDEEIIALKSYKDTAYALSSMGNMYTVKADGIDTLSLIGNEFFDDFLVFNDYLILQKRDCIYIYAFSNNEINKENTILEFRNISKIFGIGDVCFVLTSGQLYKVDLVVNKVVAKYDLYQPLDCDPVILDSDSVLLTIDTKIIKIKFDDELTYHQTIYEDKMHRKIIDLINCSGTLAVSFEDGSIGVIKEKEAEFILTSSFKLEGSGERILLSSGYGRLYAASECAIYLIKNLSKHEKLVNNNDVIVA